MTYRLLMERMQVRRGGGLGVRTGSTGGGTGSGGGTGGGTGSTLRDPWLRPFPSDWWGNVAVGSGATLVNSGLGTVTQTQIKTDGVTVSVDPNDPVKTLTRSTFYYRGDGTLQTANASDFTAQVYVDPSAGDDMKMNAIACFRDTSGRLWECQPLGLDQTSSDPVWQSPRAAFAAVRGSDVTVSPTSGSHGGSKLTAFGLTIRSHELDGTTNSIPHSLAINIPPKFVYRSGADNTTGYRWPATSADGGWNTVGSNNEYKGTVAALKLGALLTVDLGYTDGRIAAGTLTNATAIKITRTIEESGVYVVDVTGTASVYQFSVEKASESKFLGLGTTFSSELMTTLLATKVVNNNAATKVGGGGTRRRADLPALAA